MPIDTKHNAVFVHIPKTGGKTVSAILGLRAGDRRVYYADELTHMNIFHLRERLNIDGMYAFAFVRNPYTKILSEYNWRMRNISSFVFNEPTRQKMPFTEYMELLIDRWPWMTPYRERAHVLPQYTFIDNTVNVYRYEDFVSECERLKLRLGINKNTPHINKGARKPEHTARTIEIVNTLYAEDFKRFGYELQTSP